MGFSLRVQRFCCCCTLRTGTLVIGTLGLLGTLSQLFMTAAGNYPVLDDDKYGPSEKNYPISNNRTVNIGAVAISILVTLLLFVGVHKRNNKYILPWLVSHCLGLIAISVLCLISFGAIFFVNSSDAAFYIGFTVTLFLMDCLGWYFWICVWSHYMELKDIDANVPYYPIEVTPSAYSTAGVPLF